MMFQSPSNNDFRIISVSDFEPRQYINVSDEIGETRLSYVFSETVLNTCRLRSAMIPLEQLSAYQGFNTSDVKFIWGTIGDTSFNANETD